MNSTAKDIAKNLGISQATVSIVLNGKRGVSNTTREEVLAEAERLGISPKIKSDDVHKNIRYVIFMDEGLTVSETFFHSIILQGIEERAKGCGYNVLISYFNANEDWNAQIKTITNNVSGIILLGTEVTSSHVQKAIQLRIDNLQVPIVMVDNAFSNINVDCVVQDNQYGAYIATKALFAHGAKDVGYLRSKSRIDNFDERELGFRKARRVAGISPSIQPHIVNVGVASATAYSDMCNWLDEGNKPCAAYFADNDIIAVAAIRALKQHGYSIPADVAIIGFDDMPFCDIVEPTLSSIRVQKEQMGSEAMRILDHKIHLKLSRQADEAAVRVTVANKLIERESSRIFSSKH